MGKMKSSGASHVKSRWMTAIGGVLIWSIPILATAGRLYDIDVLDRMPLAPKVLSSKTEDSIIKEKVSFSAMIWEGKPVRITADITFPKGARNLPAIIHTGGTDLEREANDIAKRGYVFCDVHYRWPIGMSRDAFIVRPSPRHSSFYYEAVSLIRTVSYLQRRPEVNPEAIGSLGTSYGGMFTCYLAGIDYRIKAAITLFGCGHMDRTWWAPKLNDLFKSAEDRHIFMEMLDPGAYHKDIKAPILFLSGTNDFAFWFPNFLSSYGEVLSEKRLSLLTNGNHSTPVGMEKEGILAWFEWHLKGKEKPFPKITSVSSRNMEGNLQVVIEASGPAPILSVDVSFSQEAEGEWRSRLWDTVPGQFKEGSWVVEIPVEDPDEAVIFFVSVKDARNLTVSSQTHEVLPRKIGINNPTRKLDIRPALYDSKGHPSWINHQWLQKSKDDPKPAQWDSAVKHGNDPSLKLAGDSKEVMVFPDMNYTLMRWMHGRPVYCLSLWVKSNRLGQMVRIGFMGKNWEKTKEFSLNTDWQQLEFKLIIQGDYRFTVVPVCIVPAGQAQDCVWITELSADISPASP